MHELLNLRTGQKHIQQRPRFDLAGIQDRVATKGEWARCIVVSAVSVVSVTGVLLWTLQFSVCLAQSTFARTKYDPGEESRPCRKERKVVC